MLRSHVCLLVPIGHHRVEEHPDTISDSVSQMRELRPLASVYLECLFKNAKCWDLESAFSVSLLG